MQSNPAYASLIDMGCNPMLCAAAIKNLKTQDLSVLLDWVSDHSEEQQKWAGWLKQNESEKLKQEGQSIEQLINQQLRDQLMTKGHSKNVSEKSLLFTNNASVQAAEKWIDQHKTEPDFQEELRVEGQSETVKLSPEQAKARLQQLTKKARQVRKQRQQQQAKQREKNRVRYAKEMLEAKRIAEEQAMKRQVELDKIQKQRDQEYKRKLVEQMRRQRNEKLGIKQQEGQNFVEKKKQIPKLSLIEQVQLQCEQVRVGNHAYPDIAKTFFETAHIYVGNILKNNGEQKFRKINRENKAFQNRICQAFGGLQLLTVLGYQEEENFLFMKQFNLGDLTKVSNILERYKSLY